MAVSMKYSLRMTFETTSGEGKSITLNRANDEATDAQVKALTGAIVTNKVIFADQPTKALTAQLISTTTTDYDLE